MTTAWDRWFLMRCPLLWQLRLHGYLPLALLWCLLMFGGWIGWMTRHHALGLCVDPQDPDQVNAALAQLRPGQPAAEAAREAAARFADQRSEAAFAAAMLRCLPGA